MSYSFAEKLSRYADLAVRVGVGLKPGGRLVVRGTVDCAPFIRVLVEKAYQAGARLVDVVWADDVITLSRYRHAPADSFDEPPFSAVDPLKRATERGDSVLSIYGTDPDLLKDQDPDSVSALQRATQNALKEHMARIMTNEVAWCVIAAPVQGWAQKVLPDRSPEAQMEGLWDAIFTACRIDQPDPVAAWRTHMADLGARRRYLNERQYTAFAYNGPGTDVTVGMPKNHTWLGGQGETRDGRPFVANMPTEEVFSLPHRGHVEGTVSATKPLSYAGTLIEGLTFTFADGRIEKASAKTGERVLHKLLDTDEGARRLGEIALVPNSSGVAKAGLLFYNTLFDENAASHLAIGRAYRTCLQGGTDMSDADFTKAGGNDSLTHVDFMIGSDDIDVDGVTASGDREPVMRAGEWAFDV